MSAVYHHHAAPLLHYGTRLTNGDRHKAEDLLQEAALRAWRHFSPPPADALSIRPWLFTVLRNLAIDHHRNRAIRAPETHLAGADDLVVDDITDHLLTGQLVRDAVTRLGPAHHEVITLLYCHDHSVAHAAAHLGIPIGTVKSRTHHALRMLRRILHDRGVTPECCAA
ncbi:sigma-70 family RNA polymerase sigma factor [Streptomyces sp. DH12]|uniref:sigma-70 family RNA polymerase sigma factor n=1 Tax=Streptomyces sp. DH12 TaxID=2857010 RepID=UPI001E56B021|nr:sigma-70 family RNA polymerase sigma factor [Streptomyces sp. DH12]